MKKGHFYHYPDRYKDSTVFACNVRSLVSAEKDKYLSLANLDNIRAFLPEIDLEKNIDLLAWAGDSFVANRVNKNDDGVTTEDALKIADLFPYKFADSEHERNHIVGVILTAGFTEFGSNKVLTREEVEKTTKPFNVTIGGIVWRAINPEFADALEESNDPTSKLFEKISLSWEIAFAENDIVLLDKEDKNIEDGVIITESSKKIDLERMLRCHGGSGVTDDGKRVCRVIRDPLPVGIGFVEHPAADVQGIITSSECKKDPENEENAKNNEKNIENSSQNKNLTVKEDDKVMKLSNIKDITDENLKEVKASELMSLLDAEIKKISDDYMSKKTEVETTASELKKKNEDLEKQLSDLQKQFTELVEANKKKEAEETFTARMEYFDDKFNLTKEDREIIGKAIAGMDEEKFKDYSKSMDVLLKEKVKTNENAKASTPATEPETKPQTATANENVNVNKPAEPAAPPVTAPAAPQTAVDNALDAGKKEPNTVAATTTTEVSLVDKYKQLFGPKNWVSTNKRNRK